jgi:hypothetical protein
MTMEPNNSLFGYSLSYSLQSYEKFQKLTPPEQAAILELARKFETLYDSHFKGPEALAEELGGTPDDWRRFLTLKPVRDYVKRKTDEDVEILNRQALYKQAQKAALSGETQAAKLIKELAEANASQTNQTKVILHYIPRPNHE